MCSPSDITTTWRKFSACHSPFLPITHLVSRGVCLIHISHHVIFLLWIIYQDFFVLFLVWISIFLDPLFIFLHVHLTLHSWWIFSEAPVLFFYKNVFGYGHVLSTFILQTLYPISDSNRKKFLHTNIFPNIPSRWFLFHGFFVLFLFWSSHITLKLYTHVLH